MPETLAEYRFPQPGVRRIAAPLLGLALVAAALLVIIQLVLALFIGPLLGGTAILTAVLIIPLMQRSVLHPEIDVSEAGLMLHPMIWPAQFVTWDALTNIVPHPLVYNDEAMGRVLHGKHYHLRQGAVILVNPDARLWPVYLLVGQLAGAGNVPAFAVSSTTHTEYEALINLFKERIKPTDVGAR